MCSPSVRPCGVSSYGQPRTEAPASTSTASRRSRANDTSGRPSTGRPGITLRSRSCHRRHDHGFVNQLGCSMAGILTRKAKAFWPLLLLLVFADCTTKRLAEEHLMPEHVPHSVVGEVVQFTLAYNRGAAFNVS